MPPEFHKNLFNIQSISYKGWQLNFYISSAGAHPLHFPLLLIKYTGIVAHITCLLWIGYVISKVI